jgi:DNA-binding NtrC family response regulator
MRRQQTIGNREARWSGSRREGRYSWAQGHPNVWHTVVFQEGHRAKVKTPKRILVVDDEDRVLMVLQEGLAMLGEGYEIATAHDGLEALGKIKEREFDVLITDLRMAGMDGEELTEAVRTWDPAIQTIWITAYDCHEVRAEAERLAVYRCLDKPVDIEDIRAVVLEALEKRPEDSASGNQSEGPEDSPAYSPEL